LTTTDQLGRISERVKETTRLTNRPRNLTALEKKGGGRDANNRRLRLPEKAIRRMISREIARLALVREGRRQLIPDTKTQNREVEWTNPQVRVNVESLRRGPNHDRNNNVPRVATRRAKRGARKENSARSSLVQKLAIRRDRSATSKKNSVRNASSSKSSARDLETSDA
jgi:hypothetical protein